MEVNWRYVVGVGTIAGVLGLTTYAIILHKRQQKQEEGSMSVEEAMELVEKNKKSEPDELYIQTEGHVLGGIDLGAEELNHWTKPPNISDKEEDINKHLEDLASYQGMNPVKSDRYTNDQYEKALEDIRKTVAERADIEFSPDMKTIQQIYARPVEEVEEENEREDTELEEEELREEQIEPEPILLQDEGDGKLRYDPNSDEALVQFMRMELAEWAPHEEVYKTLMELYDMKFEPKVDGDVHLHAKLVDYRAEFFGPASRWAVRISITDLVLHFARLADFNVGGGVRYWAGHFLEVNRINIFDMSIDHMEYMFNLMNHHEFFRTLDNGDDIFSFFGLDKQSIDNATEIASRNIDSSLTYEIEFNEFLKNANNQL